MIGYIYLSTCTITNKVYVGMTIQKYKRRWKDHIKDSFNSNSTSYNYHFHKAIRKYGVDSFKWEVLETVYKDSKEILESALKDLEIKYIEKYNSFKNGYNSTAGGDTSRKECTAINVYDSLGNLLRSFQNVCEASEYYNISKSVIWSCCGRFSTYALCDKNRVVFRWASDTFSDNDLKELNRIHYDATISMYSVDGTFIKTFVNVSEASAELHVNRDRITCCCSKTTSFVLINGSRYIFRYFDEKPTPEDTHKAISIKSDPKSKVQAIDSITNEVIKEFNSQKDGSRYFNISASRISEVCSGKRRSAGKYNGHPVKWIKI